MPKAKPKLLRQSNDAEWRGMLAGLLFVGAGLWLGGSKRRAVIVWAAFTFVPPLMAISLYWSGVSPSLSWIAAAVAVFVWLANLQLSWRPIPPQPKWMWPALLGMAAVLGLGCRMATDRLVHTYIMPDDSMSPALQPQDQVLFHQFAYWFKQPERGEIVAFHRPDTRSLSIKRVIGLPGETLVIDAGSLKVNDKAVAPARVLPGAKHLTSPQDKFVVPADSVFVLSDSPAEFYDSRSYGAVPVKDLVGKASVINYPAGRIGRVN